VTKVTVKIEGFRACENDLQHKKEKEKKRKRKEKEIGNIWAFGHLLA